MLWGAFAPSCLRYITVALGSVMLDAPQRLNRAHPCFEVLRVLLRLPEHGWRLILETRGRFHRLHALLKGWRHISTASQGLGTQGLEDSRYSGAAV